VAKGQFGFVGLADALDLPTIIIVQSLVG